MKTTLDSLQALDLDRLKPFFAEPVEARNVGAGLKADRLHVARYRRQLIDARRAKNAEAALPRLPQPGESLHLIASGLWPAWALVGVMLTHAAPATITSLHLATLGFSRSNAEELLALLDAGRIGSVTMLGSCYFKSHERDLSGWLASELLHRRQRIAYVRTHAKVIAATLADGTAIATESSANLRSCNNVEQFVITNAPALVAFHAKWIDDVLRGGDQK